ncbi:Mannan endo-1,6-alpha-mannosidase DFG5 [Orchesella cincta]|uniref:Mannan endo-1,6-alpha-mannosidase DFG5 n=1 Tax=Orchesella cincta TaxID=48709 RepID=A0A1D2MM71_ORCCI|nr:Mannan endo-1,6-alpha-mannosidase DFG5 [Orchesella cincta]
MRHLYLLALLLLASVASAQVCNIFCDGRGSGESPNSREAVSAEIFGRRIRLYISDSDNMGFAEMSNGDPGDEVWIDRSFNAGVGWDGKLGTSFIPSGSREVRTLMYNVDNPSGQQIGALRACGKPGNMEDIACTSWARSTVNAERQVDAAATALMQFWNGALWSTTGWWNGANCLNALLDYFTLTGAQNYRYMIDTTFERNKNEHFGDFTNDYIDDTLWWGLAWLRAYELTGNQKYLETAKHTSDYSYDGYRDDVCGGGVWWRIQKDYKNAITNELFIKLAASLHNKIPGDTKYLSQAVEVWNWLKNSGMINNENLINDGLTDDCRNNGDVTWSYNQGVILGGLTELFKATRDQNYLTEARKIADAVMNSGALNPNGILREYGCGDGDCGVDGASFKGAFVRNLGELNRELDGRPYSEWLRNQAASNWNNNRNSLNQFGLRWEGPVDKIDASRQHSALEAFIAAL